MTVLTDIEANAFQQEVLESDIAVLVDFWSPRCGPCRVMERELEALAAEYGERLKAVKVNIDENHDLAMQYDVMSVPTVILFKNGSEAERIIGSQPRRNIAGHLDAHI